MNNTQAIFKSLQNATDIIMQKEGRNREYRRKKLKDMHKEHQQKAKELKNSFVEK